MKHYLNAVRNYANIKGRMSRSAFWQFVLFNILFWVVMLQLDQITRSFFSFKVFSTIYNIFIFSPSFSTIARRLHDTGRSGKWGLLLFGVPYLLGLIPLFFASTELSVWYNTKIIYALRMYVSLTMTGVLLYLLSVAGDVGENKYGPDPMWVKTDKEGV